MKLLITSLIFWFFANAIDLYSTIIQSPQAEENPFMRMIWTHYGNIGFIYITFMSWCLIQWLVVMTAERSKAIPITLILLSVFKILIGLTNLTLIPISITGWFTY